MQPANQPETWYCADAELECVYAVQVEGKTDYSKDVMLRIVGRRHLTLMTNDSDGVFYRPTFEEARQAIIEWYEDKIVEFTNAITRIKGLES